MCIGASLTHADTQNRYMHMHARTHNTHTDKQTDIHTHNLLSGTNSKTSILYSETVQLPVSVGSKLFGEKLLQNKTSLSTIQPLCPTTT